MNSTTTPATHQIPGIGPVVAEQRPHSPNAAPDAWRPFLGWACQNRTVPADPSDIIDAARSLIAPFHLDANDTSSALEGLLYVVAALMSVVDAARLQNQTCVSRGLDPVFAEPDLAELGHLARRLADHGPHLVAEINGVEERQDALWEAATTDESEVRQ